MSNVTKKQTSLDNGLEIRRRAFERKARQATHQILFYLGLYYRPITFWSRKTHERTDEVLRHDSGLILARLQALVAGVGYRDDEEVEAESWRKLREKIENCTALWPYQPMGEEPPGETGTDKRLQELRDTCVNFLRESGPRDLNTRITHLLNTVKVQVRQWLAKILVSFAAIYLLFFFQQVAGLLRQTGWWGLLPFLLFTMVAVAPDQMGRRQNRHCKQYWWDFGGQPLRNWNARPPERGFGRFAEDSHVPFALMLRSLMNIATYFIALAGVLLLAFLVASWQDAILFTIAMILALLFLLYGAAKLLDFWDFYHPEPVRMAFLLFVLLAVVGINTYKLWLAPLFLWAFVFMGLCWLVWKVRKKVQRMSLPDALKTSGLDASITLGVLGVAWLVTNIATTQFGEPWQDDGSKFERLAANDWPKSVKKWFVKPGEKASELTREDPVVVLAASGGGSRAAIYTAHTLLMLHEKEFRHIGCNLQAISSVSGGSLANAVYLTQRLRKPCDDDALHEGLQGEKGLVKAVARDFLQPTIRGALHGTFLNLPGGSGGGRSEYIESAWKDIGLDVKLDKLAEVWRKAPAGYPPFPTPLFNSTSLETHRVVLSPLERTFYTDPVVGDSARNDNLYDILLSPENRASNTNSLPARYPKYKEQAERPTWVYYRDGVYSLEDLLPEFTPNLAQCVRASANFPVGFPLVKVETMQTLLYSPSVARRKPGNKEAKHSIYLSDGGVLSNSGVISLYHLLRNQVAKLRERGVLVIIVDASAMQNYSEPWRIQGLFDAIKSQQPIGQSLHRRMLESLKEQYKERIQIVQIDLIPTESTNVETTWTLSADRQNSLENQFKARQPEFKKDLETAWNVLVSGDAKGPNHYLERPPVD